MSKTYTLHDLLLAVIDERESSRNIYPDVVAYYKRRSTAFQDAFDMHFIKDELPPGKHTLGWDQLFRAAIDSYLSVGTPFSRFLEMPQSFEPFLEAFAQSFDQCANELRQLHLDFLATLCERWYGDRTKRIVTSSDLLTCGFDDSVLMPDIPN